MIDEVKVSYTGDIDYPTAGYVVDVTSVALPRLPRKGQIVTIFNGAQKQTVKIKNRSLRREGKTLHVAFDVMEICNA